MADPTIRPAESDDLGRVREVAESSFTSSYAMSPNDIETIVEETFGEEALSDRLDDDDAALLVAEVEDVLAGVATSDGEEIDWLHVDPERRGLGVGSALFERAREAAENGDEVRATALAANTSSGQFFERFGFERVEERQRELGDQEVVEHVFAPADAGTDSESASDSERVSDADEPIRPTERDDLDLPEGVEADGQQLELSEDSIPGSEGGFIVTLAEDGEEYGYYCVNCESTDVTVDSMDRIRCGDCGNTHKPKEEYDASYL